MVRSVECGESAGQWHRQDRADTKAQENRPEYTIVHPHASLGKRHERDVVQRKVAREGIVTVTGPGSRPGGGQD